MKLVAFVGKDKENWGQITGLIKRSEDKVILVKNQEADDFPEFDNCEEIKVNSNKPMIELRDEIRDKMKNKADEFEVSLSIASGTGKEHMALISALLTIPVGIRIVVFTKNGIEYIN